MRPPRGEYRCQRCSALCRYKGTGRLACACGHEVIPAGTSKFGNKRCQSGGLTFDSQAERERWLILRQLEEQGRIKDLRRQVKFDLVVNGVLITTWRCDFQYVDCDTNEQVVEDVKGKANDRWPMKKKLMLAVHGIDVREIKS